MRCAEVDAGLALNAVLHRCRPEGSASLTSLFDLSVALSTGPVLLLCLPRISLYDVQVQGRFIWCAAQGLVQ